MINSLLQELLKHEEMEDENDESALEVFQGYFN